METSPTVGSKHSCPALGRIFVCCLFSLWSLYSQSQPATEHWFKPPGISGREILLSSVTVNWPLINYRMRYSEATKNPLSLRDETPISASWLLELNCATLSYRERFYSVSSLGPWQTLDGKPEEFRREFDYVCKSNAPAAENIPKQTEKRPSLAATGTGFLVAQDLVVTNHHVIDGCTTVSIVQGRDRFSAQVESVAKRNDLALLSTKNLNGKPPPIRMNAALGEDIIVAGHPLHGLLATDLIVTGGQINALAGLSNDPSHIQISAPVQAGNSGGPVIDRSGSIVGVVVSKLNVDRAARTTGDISQNVNFAIKPEVLRLFLDTNRIQYSTANVGRRLEGSDLAERARAFTLQVLCEK